MPVLPIVAADGNPLADADDRLLAVMLAPRDDCARQQAYVALRSWIEVDPAARLQGEMAGDLLVLVEHVARHEGAGRASLKRAMRLYDLEHARRRDSRGKRMPTSETNLKRAWHNYSTVAHLWAAWRWLFRIGGPGAKFPLVNLLMTAEYYREFGEQHRVLIWNSKGRVGEPLLDGKHLWRLPSHIELPRIPADLLATEPGTRYDEFLSELETSKSRAKPN